MTFMGIAGATE